LVGGQYLDFHIVNSHGNFFYALEFDKGSK
jgi:hypothetical protein